MKYLSVFIVAALFYQCSNKKKEKKAPKIVKPVELSLKEHFTLGLKNHIQYDDICFQTLPHFDTIINFYKSNDFNPVLLNYIKIEKNKKIIFDLFITAQHNGYPSEIYRIDEIKNSLDSINNKQNVAKHSILAETFLASSLIQMHSDLRSSRVNPYEISNYSFEIKGYKSPEFEDILLDNPKTIATRIKSKVFKSKNYKLLKKELNRLLMLNGGFTAYNQYSPSDGFKNLHPGQIDSTGSLGLLRNWLDYKNNKTTFKKRMIEPYDSGFIKSINKLNKTYKLDQDSIIRKDLIRGICRSIRFRIKNVSMNMERLKWYDIKTKPGSLFVNIAANEIWAFKDDSLKLNFRTCSGKKRASNYYTKMLKYKETSNFYDKPLNRETPEMSAVLAYMIINPTWTIPQNIIVREMWGRMRRDSNYLSKNDYAVYYRGKKMNSKAINWSKINPLRNPYKIVQMPGKSNVLGRVKYIFHNKHSIYLHDTKNKGAFKRDYRNVSHGCVRLERPLKLLEFMGDFDMDQEMDDVRIFLGEEPLGKDKLIEYNMMKADSSMMELLEPIPNFKIKAKKKIYIYITYFTCYPTILTEKEKRKRKKIKINYYNDPYKKDNMLYHAMWK